MPFRYDWAGRLEGADGCVDSIAYSGNDAPTSVACVNGVSATYTLDVRNRIRQIHAINLIAQETALGPGAYVRYYCTTPGMIYYYADDGISLAREPVPAQDPAPAAAAMTMMALLRAILDAFSALSRPPVRVPVP